MSEERQILLIEDSDTQALLLGATLQKAGLAVHRVASAEEGLAYLQSNRPDLAVVDQHLPGMEGNEFCRALRHNSATESIPLLILTDDDHADSEQHMLDSGADDYVAKSTDIEILLARIDLLLRRSQLRASNGVDERTFYKAQHVLLVDDSPTYLAFLESEISHDGYNILTASSGEAAVEIARTKHVDCAVVDLIMPGIDGIELCKELIGLRKPGRLLPVLIVTAHGSKEKMLESLEVGADDYVEKSNDPTVLRARLRALLRRKMLQEEFRKVSDEIHSKELELVRERARNEAHLRAILDNAADGIVVFDDSGSILNLNKASETIFGYPAEEITGKSIFNLMPESTDLGDVKPADLVGAGPRGVEARRRDGTPFPAEFTIGEIKTSDDHFFVGIVRDVTERVQAEADLRAADEQIHLLLDSVGEGVYGVDLEGRLTFINRSAETMLGYSEQELLGRVAHDVFACSGEECEEGKESEEGPDKDGATDHALETIRTRKPIESIEVTFRKADHTVLPVVHSCYPVLKDEELVGAVVSFEDVSDKRELEARLRQAQKMEAMGRLTGGVAHDFNNLLTTMIGNLQLLQRSLADNESALGRIARVMRAAKSGAELTRRLLSFSRQQVLQMDSIDLKDLVQDMEDMLSRTMGETIDISTSFTEKPCWGHSDRNQLENALLNLCVNARDAMPDGGQLTVELRRVALSEEYAQTRAEVEPGRYIELAVSDTGTGIPPDTLSRIFEPFFTTKDMTKGTGLGLATIFGFMKQSGGHIAVYSEVGQGTTFKLYVPEDESHMAAGDVEEAAAQQQPSRAAREATLLVVEDEEDVREIAVSLLTSVGYKVIEAGTGVEGLEAFAAHPEIDLVLSDVVMPGGMSGPEMIGHIREQRPSIPIVFACGYAKQALTNRNADLQLPNSRFLPKPYDVDELTSYVESLL